MSSVQAAGRIIIYTDNQIKRWIEADDVARLERLVASAERITADMRQWHDTGAHRAPFEFCNQPACRFARELIKAQEAGQ